MKKVIKHDLFDDQKQNVLSVITYEFVRDDHQTMLHAQEELNYETTDEQYQELNAESLSPIIRHVQAILPPKLSAFRF